MDIQFWDEATNISVILESADSPDPLNLKYTNEPFWEKPPLFYWIGIILYKVFQPGNLEEMTWLFRSISSFSGLLLISSCWFFLKKKFSVFTANLSLLVFLSIPAFWLFNPTGFIATHNFRSVDSDILQLLFIMLGVFFIENLAGDFKKTRNTILIGIFIGLAVLTKGIFGFIPLFILFWKLVVQIKKNTVSFKQATTVFSIALFSSLLIVLPWHIYMYTNFGTTFFNEYFLYHQLGRASSSLEGHNQPTWFYILNLLDPRFSGILILTLITFISTKYKATKELWIGLGLITLFSLIQTKISWYILPAYPFLIIYISKKLRGLLLIFCSAFFLFQIFSIGQKIITFPNGIQSHADNYTFVTTDTLHRVFYIYELKQNSKVIVLKDEEPVPSSIEKLVVDKNGINHINFVNISKLESLSDNYALVTVE